MKEKHLEHARASRTQPTGSVTYTLEGVADLHEQWESESDGYSFSKSDVAERVAEQWFKRDFPLLSVGTIVAEKERVGLEEKWVVTIVHTASTSIRGREWNDE